MKKLFVLLLTLGSLFSHAEYSGFTCYSQSSDKVLDVTIPYIGEESRGDAQYLAELTENEGLKSAIFLSNVSKVEREENLHIIEGRIGRLVIKFGESNLLEDFLTETKTTISFTKKEFTYIESFKEDFLCID